MGSVLGIAIIFSLLTGVRRGELLALKWSDIDLDKRLVYVKRTVNRVKNYDNEGNKTKLIISDTKTPKSRRVIPMSTYLYEVLKEHK